LDTLVKLDQANALISGTFSVSETVGPALGGLLVATVALYVLVFLMGLARSFFNLVRQWN